MSFTAFPSSLFCQLFDPYPQTSMIINDLLWLPMASELLCLSSLFAFTAKTNKDWYCCGYPHFDLNFSTLCISCGKLEWCNCFLSPLFSHFFAIVYRDQKLAWWHFGKIGRHITLSLNPSNLMLIRSASWQIFLIIGPAEW